MAAPFIRKLSGSLGNLADIQGCKKFHCWYHIFSIASALCGLPGQRNAYHRQFTGYGQRYDIWHQHGYAVFPLQERGVLGIYGASVYVGGTLDRF